MPSLIATLGLNASTFIAGLNRASSEAKAKGSSISNHLGGELSSKLTGLVSIAAFQQLGARALEFGGKVQDLSNRLGISTDAVQQWDFALRQNGSTIDAAVPFFERLAAARQKALEGNQAMVASFAKLGITLAELKTQRLDNIASDIAKAFQEGDPQQLIAALRDVGGKAAGALVPAFREGLAEALQEAPLINPQDIESLDRAADALGALKAEAFSMLAPLIADIANGAMAAIEAARVLLAVPVGALMGVVDQIRSMGLADLLQPYKAAGKLGRSALDGAGEAVAAMALAANERDDKAALRRQRLTQHKPFFDAEDIVDKTAEKKAKAEAKQAEAEARQAERAEREQERQREQEEKEKERMLKEAIREGARFGTNSVNSQQQIGTFFGNFASAGATHAPEMAAMNAQVRSEQHLREIKDLLRSKSGVEF